MLFATLLTLALFHSAHAQTLDKAKLDQLFDRLLEKNKAMGSVTITKDGNILYTRSFGYRQVTGPDKKPATADTKYRIASITKMYTAVMIFQLAEEGKLKLTDTLDKFFPQIPNATRITIAQMLHHRSGIHDLEADGSWGKQPRTRDEIIARIAQGHPDFEPDAMHRYSNAGYVLLGYILEKAGGKPYSEALTERITSKLGLNDTYLGVGSTDAGRNESLSYAYFGAWKEQALFDLKLVSEDSFNQMKTMKDGEGMGMEPFSFAGKTLYGHTGGSGSSGAWLAYYPEERLAFAYTTNAKIYPVSNIVSGVFDIYWNRPFQIPALDAFDVSPEILDRYVGVYSNPAAPAKLTFTRDGATLFFQPAGNSAVPIEAMSENKFKIDPAVFFEFDAAGQLTLTRAGTARVFTKEKQ
jgi:CubicO group peptidase (beta-lactamase class C family)